MAVSYNVNEIFYSIQGEGANAGKAAVFVRFSGCNLACGFCDTDHRESTPMTATEITDKASAYASRLVVLTGGEPGLWVDDELVSCLKKAGFTIAIETNGTCRLPAGIDYVTMSPKNQFCDNAEPVLESCDELKLVFTEGVEPSRYDHITARERIIQPCDTGDNETNDRLTALALDYVMAHPRWRLGLQLHKLLNVR